MCKTGETLKKNEKTELRALQKLSLSHIFLMRYIYVIA
jgi:hypothetical protein